MAASVTDLKQWGNGYGYISTGKIALTGSYTTGGVAVSFGSIRGVLNELDHVDIGISGNTTGFYDHSTGKVRVFKIATGVFTELANGVAYDANVELPFVAYSR